MKSEERHQLLTNDLGVVTTKTVGFFERHTGTIVAAVCGILLVAAVGFFWTQGAESQNVAGWSELDSAKNLEEFGTVVDKFKGKPPAHWAQLKIAEETLQNAMPLMFTNRELALTDVKSAREKFDSLATEKGVSPVIRERALWGIALCLETACEGDTAAAIKAYDNLIAEYPDTIFKAVADERIVALKKNGATEFYAWFSKEDPKPPEARPKDFNINLPAPGEQKDEADDVEKENPPKNDVPAGDKPDAPPATGEKKDETAKPVDNSEAEKPAADKPAEPAKPAESEKPPATDPPKDGDKKEEKN